MNWFSRYIIPFALIVLSVYNFRDSRWVEGLLYASVGTGFALMGMLKAGQIKSNKRFWNAVSWALVISALILFFLTLRMDAYNF